MKLSISNIAWTATEDDKVLALLPTYGVTAIEIAPTRIWTDWQYDATAVGAFREVLQQKGLGCSSLQAILYGKPDLKLFGTSKEKAALIEHLKQVADLAANLGAVPLVLGAPKNRDQGDKDEATAFAEAVDLLSEVADYFDQRNVCLCLEPNPSVYGCNFITNSQSGAQLVRTVNSPGFRLHLDAAGMYLAGEDIPRAIQAAADTLAHFHISEPHLGNFAEPQVPHREIAQALQAIGWNQWVVIEMRSSEQPITTVRQALETVIDLYNIA